jgi:hypothetical protein
MQIYQHIDGFSLKQCSHQLWRISAGENAFRAILRGRGAQPVPHNPRKQGKSSRSPIRRTLSLGQVAEGMGLISNLLHFNPLKSCFSLGASGDFQHSL